MQHHRLEPAFDEVRPARQADIPELKRVARASWTKAYRFVLGTRAIDAYLARSYGTRALAAAFVDPRATFLVASRGEEISGFCHFGNRGRGAEVFQLYIAPRYWARGLGRRLLSHAESQFLVLGRRRYFLTVHRANIRAIMFYKRLGFIHDRDLDVGDEWHMAKWLHPVPISDDETRTTGD